MSYIGLRVGESSSGVVKFAQHVYKQKLDKLNCHDQRKNMWELNIFEANKQKIAEIVADGIVVNDERDALDIMANAGYAGARGIILHAANLNPDFFELRTGIAGEILLKFTNYQMKLAIIGEFDKFESKSLTAFITESNRGNLIFFMPDREAALTRLTK